MIKIMNLNLQINLMLIVSQTPKVTKVSHMMISHPQVGMKFIWILFKRILKVI